MKKPSLLVLVLLLISASSTVKAVRTYPIDTGGTLQAVVITKPVVSFKTDLQPLQAIEAVQTVTIATPIPATPQSACIDPTSAMSQAGIDPSDYMYVDYIVSHEGSWCGATRYNAAGSGAYGLCQALPGSKMASAGSDWLTNPVTQLKWCNSYAQAKGGWYSSYLFWISNNWW